MIIKISKRFNYQIIKLIILYIYNTAIMLLGIAQNFNDFRLIYLKKLIKCKQKCDF